MTKNKIDNSQQLLFIQSMFDKKPEQKETIKVNVKEVIDGIPYVLEIYPNTNGNFLIYRVITNNGESPWGTWESKEHVANWFRTASLLNSKQEEAEPLLSIYVNENGVYFWENQVVDSDEVRFKIEEDFGISHNRTMDIESFQNDIARFGYGNFFGQYIIIRDENHIAHLVEEYKMEG